MQPSDDINRNRSRRSRLAGLLAAGLSLSLLAAAPATPTETAKLTAADAAAGDEFGISVAIDGDTMVIGAYGDDGGTGSAYVFTDSGSGYTQTAKLTAADAAAGDNFGYSVAISGDTIVVGAYGDDDAGSVSGSAYVFTDTGSGYTQTAKLTASDAAAGDVFGYNVTISGNTIVVGARFNGGSGSAYVFTDTGSGYTQTAKLTASDAAGGDRFGHSVAIDGNTIIIGAYGNSDHGFRSGSAYVFTDTGSGYTQTAKLTASDAAAEDYFGNSVAIDGDTLVVSGYFNDDAGSGSGSVYVFADSGSGYAETAKLTASDAAADDYFGQGVAIDGDTIVVSAFGDDDAGSRSGSAYVFTDEGTGYAETAKLTASDAAADDYFGQRIALDGDTIVVGANLDDDGGTNSGSAYVFAPPVDTDGDGVPDDDDTRDESDIRSTAYLGDTDLEIPNPTMSDGWTVNDRLTACADDGTDRYAFGSCLRTLAKAWRADTTFDATDSDTLWDAINTDYAGARWAYKSATNAERAATRAQAIADAKGKKWEHRATKKLDQANVWLDRANTAADATVDPYARTRADQAAAAVAAANAAINP